MPLQWGREGYKADTDVNSEGVHTSFRGKQRLEGTGPFVAYSGEESGYVLPVLKI